MDAYIYQADIFCKDCGEAIIHKLENDNQYADRIPANPQDESSYDSDDYPKGPYSDGGGEADCPQHCGMCRVHLQNPLTPDGEQYVLQAINVERNDIPEWRKYYSYLFV